MHEVLLLFFSESLMSLAQLLYADQEQHAVEVFRFLAKHSFNFSKKRLPVSFEIEVAFKHFEGLPNIQKHVEGEE